MLKSLQIKNFKNIQNVKIDSLARVNLITGKNNTSKTSILEAVGILASGLDFEWLDKILKERGERLGLGYKEKKDYGNLKSLSSFFYNRNISFDGKSEIFIGDIEKSDFISLQFVRYINETIKVNSNTSETHIIQRRLIAEDEILAEFSIGLEVSLAPNNTVLLPIDESVNFFRPNRFVFSTRNQHQKNFHFIKPSFDEAETNGMLWDKITLSEKEDNVVEILQIIEPNIEKIAFIRDEESRTARRVTAKVKGHKDRVPLRAMGDGINRVLSIALGLVNSDNGYLLIDEFENGLHYSVQKQLWEIVFLLSEVLNIQIFATTHSEDCIKAFAEVLSAAKYSDAGKLFRLEKNLDNIVVVEYNSQELAIASEYKIETR
jgi:AAA15 family ATPase/GTPase